LKLRDVRQQVNENAPKLLEELFELADFIIGTYPDLRLIVTTDDPGSDHNDVVETPKHETVKQREHENEPIAKDKTVMRTRTFCVCRMER